MRQGAIVGFVVGLLTLGAVLAVVAQCLPFRISSPPPPWPWFCNNPVYGAVGYLAFPVNLLTNDLTQAIFLAPLAMIVYVLIGSLIGQALSTSRGAPRK